MTSTAPVEVVPFWQRLGPISRYPLQSGALLHVLLFTALRLADLALGGIAGLIVSAFLWMGILKYAVEVLVQTAHGRLDAPEFNPSVSESQAWDQVKLQILLWIMLVAGSFGFGVLFGGVAAFAWAALGVLAIPGATITLAMTNNLWAALNPKSWIERLAAFGWPYFAVALLAGLYQLSAANAQSLALPYLPTIVAFLLSWFLTHYVLVSTFHLMGYLVLQYADRVGHEVKRDAAPERLRSLHADPDQSLLDAATAMVQDGRADEAVQIMREHIATRGGTVLLHEHYRKLLKAKQDAAELLRHAQGYVQVLLAQDNVTRPFDSMQEAFAPHAR